MESKFAIDTTFLVVALADVIITKTAGIFANHSIALHGPSCHIRHFQVYTSTKIGL